MASIEEELGIKKEIDIHEKAVVNLLYTNGCVKRSLSAFFDQYDITPTQYNVLRILRGKHPESANPMAIVKVMLEKTSDVTRLTQRLEYKNYVLRETDPYNRRKINLSITEEGLKLMEQIDVAEFYNPITKRLTSEEAATLSALLDKLRG